MFAVFFYFFACLYKVKVHTKFTTFCLNHFIFSYQSILYFTLYLSCDSELFSPCDRAFPTLLEFFNVFCYQVSHSGSCNLSGQTNN